MSSSPQGGRQPGCAIAFISTHFSSPTAAGATQTTWLEKTRAPNTRASTKFREFTPKAVCDTSQAVEVLMSLSCGSRQEVDDLVARALAAGGSTYDKPEDFGFMYTHSFLDPDGHGWGLLHMTATPA